MVQTQQFHIVPCQMFNRNELRNHFRLQVFCKDPVPTLFQARLLCHRKSGCKWLASTCKISTCALADVHRICNYELWHFGHQARCLQFRTFLTFLRLFELFEFFLSALSAFISACRFQLSLASNPGCIPWTPHPILCDPTEPQAWSVQNISKHQVNQVSIQTGHFTIKCNRHPFPNRIKSRRTCHIESILFQIGSYKTCNTESIFFDPGVGPAKLATYTPPGIDHQHTLSTDRRFQRILYLEYTRIFQDRGIGRVIQAV